MGYPKAAVDAARREFDKRKSEYENAYRALCEKLYKRYPKIKKTDEELSRTGSEIVRITLGRNGVGESLEALHKRCDELIAGKKAIIRNDPEFSDMESGRFACPECKDTGFVQGKRCRCFENFIKAEMCRRLNETSPLELSGFENFSLSHYPDKSGEGVSPRKQMEKVLSVCKDYAENFSQSSGNLLLTGGTGLGKTHLSLAMAKCAIERGYNAAYCSAAAIFDKVEKEHFGKSDEGDTFGALCECDLLVIDDLGAEFVTQFTVSAANNLINTRLLSGKPTVISTNLSLKDIEKTYGQRTLSRIAGEYKILHFVGNDIRLEKAMKG